MSGAAVAVRALQGWHCAFCFGGGARSFQGLFTVSKDYVVFRGDCIASCGFLWCVVPKNSFQRDLP